MYTMALKVFLGAGKKDLTEMEKVPSKGRHDRERKSDKGGKERLAVPGILNDNELGRKTQQDERKSA